MKTIYSKAPFIFLLSIIIFTSLVGTTLLLNVNFKEDILFYQILPFLLFLISLFKLIELLTLKELEIDSKYLIIRYLFFKREEKIKWDAIEKLRITKFENRSLHFQIYTNFGKKLEVFSQNKRIVTQSFYYKNFNQILSQFEGKISPNILGEMIKEFEFREKKFVNYDYNILSNTLTLSAIIFFLIFIYSQLIK